MARRGFVGIAPTENCGMSEGYNGNNGTRMEYDWDMEH